MNQDIKRTKHHAWYNFFIRSANSFVFDLKNLPDDLSEFSDEEIYNIVAICDNVVDKIKILKYKIEKNI